MSTRLPKERFLILPPAVYSRSSAISQLPTRAFACEELEIQRFRMRWAAFE
ncbi:hypothetical protein TWF173_006992 [Orbilia oligospora]|uniref:Uncharacterized protein n=1 Tax=Orbilia oligospora TaxID=2813651 RepID=A0A7C8VNZ2_ORBOL|nr:hypothetical protein TWF970_005778 [Orbilia oligospora]KAF3312570.1 hypothetical protein TWF173_006992 [Orbilia oligospora]